MNFIYTDEQTIAEKLFGGFRHINAFGRIVVGDAEKLLKLIETTSVPAGTTIYIDSTGGNVEEGIKLGCVIRAYHLETSIGTYMLEPKAPDDAIVPRTLRSGECLSAATLMFVGGRLRHYPPCAKFGVHRFAYRDPAPSDAERSQELSAGIARYLDQMGIPLTFLDLSASTASNELRLLGEDELREHRVITGGVTEAVWGVELRDSMIYVRGTRDSIWGRHKVILAYARDSAFVFFAVIEAQGRHNELCHFPLVELVVNGEDLRIDISDRCSRKSNGPDVIVMSNLSLEEAKILAYSESFGVQIRLTSEASVFLGVSAMSTEGGQDSLRSLYELMTVASHTGS